MPTYEIEAPDGRVLEVEGDTPPNEAQLQEIFASVAPEIEAERPGIMGTLFPSATAAAREAPTLTEEQIQAEKQRAIEMSPWGALARPEAGAAPLAQITGDVFSFTTRAAEGLKRMIKGQGVEGFLQALQDPEAGLFQETREADAAFWGDLSERAGNKAEKALFKTLGFISAGAYGAIEDPTTLLFPAKAALKRIPGITMKGVPRKALITPEGLPLTPAQVLEKEVSMVESYVQANPITEYIPRNIKERQMIKLEETASKISKEMGGREVREIAEGGSVRGALIEEKMKDVKNINQKLFGLGEDFIQRHVGQKPINFKSVDIFGPSKVGMRDASLMPIKNVVQKVTKTNAMQKMENMLSRIGHTLGEEAQNIGGISKKAIKRAEGFHGDIKNARTVEDLLNVKRNIAGEVFDDIEKGFFTGDKDIGFLRGINSQLNDAIEESIITLSPGIGGEDLARAFRSMNKQYESNLDALMTPSKKLGLGRQDLKYEDVIGKIKLIGGKNLNKIKAAAKIKPEIAPIYAELQRGAYEDLIYKSLNKGTMKISPDKLATAWNSMDAGFKKSIFPEKVIGEVDKLVKTLQRISAGDLAKLNPSGTAKVNFLTKVFRNPVDAATALLGWPMAKWYYKSGKLPHQSLWNLLRGSGGKIYLTTNKLTKIRDFESMGNFLRSELNLKKEEK